MNATTRVIRLPEVCRLVGLSRSTVLRLEAAGRFPAKFKLCSDHAVGAVGWIEAEVVAWIEARAGANVNKEAHDGRDSKR